MALTRCVLPIARAPILTEDTRPQHLENRNVVLLEPLIYAGFACVGPNIVFFCVSKRGAYFCDCCLKRANKRVLIARLLSVRFGGEARKLALKEASCVDAAERVRRRSFK